MIFEFLLAVMLVLWGALIIYMVYWSFNDE